MNVSISIPKLIFSIFTCLAIIFMENSYFLEKELNPILPSLLIILTILMIFLIKYLKKVNIKLFLFFYLIKGIILISILSLILLQYIKLGEYNNLTKFNSIYVLIPLFFPIFIQIIALLVYFISLKKKHYEISMEIMKKYFILIIFIFILSIISLLTYGVNLALYYLPLMLTSAVTTKVIMYLFDTNIFQNNFDKVSKHIVFNFFLIDIIGLIFYSPILLFYLLLMVGFIQYM